MNINQVKEDFNNGTVICRATIGEVIELATASDGLVSALQGALVDDLLQYHSPEWIAKARAALSAAGAV